MYLHPFRICILQDEEQVSQEWSCIVGMHSHPWPMAFEAIPKDVTVLLMGCYGLLAGGTVSYLSFQVSVQIRPPHVLTGQQFHLHDAWVALMQLIQDLASESRWHSSSTLSSC